MNLIMLCLSHAATFKPQLLWSKRYNCEVEVKKKKIINLPKSNYKCYQIY